MFFFVPSFPSSPSNPSLFLSFRTIIQKDFLFFSLLSTEPDRNVECPLFRKEMLQSQNVTLADECINLAGFTCNFKCVDGKERGGSREEGRRKEFIPSETSHLSLDCLINGSWSHQIPSCSLQSDTSSKECSINPPPNGSVSGICARAVIGQSCFFQCDDGSNIKGAPILTCTSDGWNYPAPTCQQFRSSKTSCAPLILPQSSLLQLQESETCDLDKVAVSGAVEGTACSLNCPPSFRLKGHSSITCLSNGSWTPPDVPLCVQAFPCPLLPSFPNARTSCEINHIFAQSSESTSRTAHDFAFWSDVERQSSIASGAIIEQTCHIQCLEGYELQGQDVVKCINGTWIIHEEEHCIKKKCSLLTLDEETFLFNSSCSGRVGDMCTIHCKPGFMFARGMTSTTFRCSSSSTWIGHPLSAACYEARCEPLIPEENVLATLSCLDAKPGDTCTFSCEENFELTTMQADLLCRNDGTWDRKAPSCIQNICQSSEITENIASGRTSCVSLANTSAVVCEYKCNDGYRLIGSAKLECELANGKWSGQQPQCIPVTCPKINPLDHGSLEGGFCDTLPGSICKLSCHEGYFTNESSSYTCSNNGIWIGSGSEKSVNDFVFNVTSSLQVNTSICHPLTCPSLQGITDGFMTGICSDASIGETCSFNCSRGFSMEGTASLVCQLPMSQKEGGEKNDLIAANLAKWSDAIPKCVKLKCPSLNLPPSVVGLLKGSCQPGISLETCYLQCPSGYRNSIRTNLLCQVDGSWDGLIEDMSCIPIQSTKKKSKTPTKPKKKTYCPNVTAPVGGKTSGQCRPGIPGNWCKVFCPAGYTGLQVIWCKSTGSWSTNRITCKRKY